MPPADAHGFAEVMKDILDFKAGYQFSDTGVSRKGTGDISAYMNKGIQHYDKLKVIG